jgi:hypothetical protein
MNKKAKVEYDHDNDAATTADDDDDDDSNKTGLWKATFIA